MSYRRAMKRPLQLTAFIAGAGAVALLIGSAQTGCGSDGGTAGTTGTAGTVGMAGTTGTGGTGGGGGSTAACDLSITQTIAVDTEITMDTMWPCKTYILDGLVSIGNNATLTIAAGTVVIGNGDRNSPAALISKRDGKLVAIGTATNPIVFTSAFDPGMRMPGDSLAGIALLGRAKINNGTCQNDGDPATPACDAPGFLQANIEGLDATDPRGLYGGNDDAHNCGELRYVRVEFAGFQIGGDNELNGITVGACGTATKLSYLQVHRGFDDGIEFFGGTAGMDHVLISGSTDDGLDWDNGWTGKVQFLIVQQAYGTGDKGFESDNLGGNEAATPRSAPEIWNATMIGQMGNTKIGMHLREGTRFKLRNFIVHGFGGGAGGGAVDVDAMMVMPAADWPAQMSIESSVFFGGPLAKDETTLNNDMGFDEAASLMDPARMNTTTADPMFPAGFNAAEFPATPSWVPGNAAAVTGKATPPAGFDTTATYAGAVDPATTTPWYAGWTAFPVN